MNYYYIYSAGGGAGDWNGIKRMWNSTMPISLKSNILLKFGDVFFNHASAENIIKPTIYRNIVNLRTWLFDNVSDPYVLDNTNILLDSGTSKIVNWIATKNPGITAENLITIFEATFRNYNILQKYATVIATSNINKAVTIDIPNSFKIRTQNGATRTIVIDEQSTDRILNLYAQYANDLYRLLGNSQRQILTTINGQWDQIAINRFFSLLNYTPTSLAIGGLTRTNAMFPQYIQRLNNALNFDNYEQVHFLGCGGINNVCSLISLDLNNPNFSVDNSTPWNRAIDGNTAGTSLSGYFDYTSKKLIRINPCTLENIIHLHSNATDPLFNQANMSRILASIIEHQSGNTSLDTYNARAQLAIHNHHVFKRNAE